MDGRRDEGMYSHLFQQKTNNIQNGYKRRKYLCFKSGTHWIQLKVVSQRAFSEYTILIYIDICTLRIIKTPRWPSGEGRASRAADTGVAPGFPPVQSTPLSSNLVL